VSVTQNVINIPVKGGKTRLYLGGKRTVICE